MLCLFYQVLVLNFAGQQFKLVVRKYFTIHEKIHIRLLGLQVLLLIHVVLTVEVLIVLRV
jgi:hypothetical protein